MELDPIEELALSDAELVVAHPVKATTESMAATTTAAIFLLIPIALTPYQFPFLGFLSDEAIMTRQP